MADDKPRDINANGLLHARGVKRESTDGQQAVDSNPNNRLQWQVRPCEIDDKLPPHSTAGLSQAFPVSEDCPITTAGVVSNQFLPSVNQQMYFYTNADQNNRFPNPRRKLDAEGNFQPTTPLPYVGEPRHRPGGQESVSGESGADTSASPPASVECVVCGDKSSGKHYGQYTCEGCKSFFKRSVRRNLSYTCRGNRTCPVDLQHRNQCQYCRFQKCIKLGMRREAVQKGRIPNNTLIYASQPVAWLSSEGTAGHPMHPVPVISPYSLTPFISSLVKADDLFSSRFTGGGDQSSHLLVSIIEWARKTPHFADLPGADQVALLKNCWHDLFLLIGIQISMPVPTAQMVSACLPPDTDPVTVMAQLGDCGRNLQNQLERLNKLGLDVAEYASLKTILLFNPDTVGIASVNQVEGIQEKIYCGLEEHIRITYQNQSSRMGRILLRLPTLCKASSQIIEQLILMRLVNRDSVESLIHNLLLRSAGAPPNTNIQSLSTPLGTFNGIGAPMQSSMASPASACGGAGVMAPQLPSPCLPVSAPMSNGSMHHPSNASTPVNSHHTHVSATAAGGGLPWLSSTQTGIDCLSMGMGTNINTNQALIASNHQAM